MASLTKYERKSYTLSQATKRNNLILSLRFSALMLSTHSFYLFSHRSLSTYFLIYLYRLSQSLVLATFSCALSRTRKNLPSGPLMAILFNLVQSILNVRTHARTISPSITHLHVGEQLADVFRPQHVVVVVEQGIDRLFQVNGQLPLRHCHSLGQGVVDSLKTNFASHIFPTILRLLKINITFAITKFSSM